MLATISTCHNHHHHHHKLDSSYNKTRCQLCKRLAWPMIPLSWSGLVWSGKEFQLWMWSLGGSQHPFISLCIGPFSAWYKPALDQWKGGLLQLLSHLQRCPDRQRGVGLVPSLFNFDGNRQHSWSASCWKRWDGLWLRRQWLCSLMQRSLVLEIIQHSCLCLNSTILPFVWHSISQNIYFLPM